jgi:hypothetical protein
VSRATVTTITEMQRRELVYIMHYGLLSGELSWRETSRLERAGLIEFRVLWELTDEGRRVLSHAQAIAVAR